MKYEDIKNAQTILVETMKRFGLGDFTLMLEESFATPDGLRLVLIKPLGGSIHTHADLAEKIKEIQTSLMDSELVNDRVVKPYRDEIAELNKEIKDLKTELGIVTKFKTHYEIEMTLRHGQPEIICVENPPK